MRLACWESKSADQIDLAIVFATPGQRRKRLSFDHQGNRSKEPSKSRTCSVSEVSELSSRFDALNTVRRPTKDVKITAIRDDTCITRPDSVTTEEPMEIRIHGHGQEPIPVTTTMRTPCNDFELAAGLLYSEGLISSHESVRAIRYCDNVERDDQKFNVVTVALTCDFEGGIRHRSLISSSACGICGTTVIEDLEKNASYVSSTLTVEIETILSIPNSLRNNQKLFSKTGGLHCAGIFDKNGELEAIREDIGRHNALDKVIGHYFLQSQLPLSSKILGLSGRIGFELVQKAAMAQIPIIVAISAPSSLAIDTAESLGITLIGFTHDSSANIYTHANRVNLSGASRCQ